jgi:Uma2 family endonuclease
MVLAEITLEQKLISGDELFGMTERGRCELIEGEVITMSPTGSTHGIIEGNLFAELKAFCRKNRRGQAMVGEVGIYIRRNPDTIRAADVLYISNERYAQRQSTGFLDVAPELVAEVLSPEDRWSEVMRKLQDYFEAGVLRVWVADPVSQSIFAYSSLTQVERFTAADTLTDESLLPGLTVAVADVFAL